MLRIQTPQSIKGLVYEMRLQRQVLIKELITLKEQSASRLLQVTSKQLIKMVLIAHHKILANVCSKSTASLINLKNLANQGTTIGQINIKHHKRFSHNLSSSSSTSWERRHKEHGKKNERETTFHSMAIKKNGIHSHRYRSPSNSSFQERVILGEHKRGLHQVIPFVFPTQHSKGHKT